jgi:hypothetical protein
MRYIRERTDGCTRLNHESFFLELPDRQALAA